MPRSAKRPRLTEAERDARRQADRERVEQAARALLTSDGWRRWIKVRASNRLARYSLRNQLLIAIDCHARGITPTYIAGFRAFLALNRCVRKGVQHDRRRTSPRAAQEHGPDRRARRRRRRRGQSRRLRASTSRDSTGSTPADSTTAGAGSRGPRSTPREAAPCRTSPRARAAGRRSARVPSAPPGSLAWVGHRLLRKALRGL